MRPEQSHANRYSVGPYVDALQPGTQQPVCLRDQGRREGGLAGRLVSWDSDGRGEVAAGQG
jgi:hypothetical protein